MDRRAAGALLALAACIASSAAAPTASNHTALDLYEVASDGCYYNFQHYGEGDRIMTNEPCLNCTCHNRMLMCYLRVCPFTKLIGQDCIVEKRADQCCPIVTCPDVPVDLLTSTSTSSPAEYGATGIDKLGKYGCSINGKYFPEGSKVPPTPNKPCEHCYCIRNMTTCVMQECTLHVDGCTPIYHKDVCCPIRYSCDHPEDEVPLLDDMSTTVRPTPGFLLTTTTLSPVTQMSQDCVHNDQIIADGASITTEKACEHCYCMKGDIVCVVQECGAPMENEGKNCTSLPPRDGQCCPDTYICEIDEISTDTSSESTTEPMLEKQTTLSPPRRSGVEGSGYRNEPNEYAHTGIPSTEPELEGSGEEIEPTQPIEEHEAFTSVKPLDTDEITTNLEDGDQYIPVTTKAPSDEESETSVQELDKNYKRPTPPTQNTPSAEQNEVTPNVNLPYEHVTSAVTFVPESYDQKTTESIESLNTVPDILPEREHEMLLEHTPFSTDMPALEEIKPTVTQKIEETKGTTSSNENYTPKPETVDNLDMGTTEKSVVILEQETEKVSSGQESDIESTTGASAASEDLDTVTVSKIMKEKEDSTTQSEEYIPSTTKTPLEKIEKLTTEPNLEQNTVISAEKESQYPHIITSEKTEKDTVSDLESTEKAPKENSLKPEEQVTTLASVLKESESTTEPDKGLNTIPSELDEHSYSQPLTEVTVSSVEIKTTELPDIIDRTPAYDVEKSSITTDSSTLQPETHVTKVDQYTITTEPSFRKEDEINVSTEKTKEELGSTTIKTEFVDEGLIPTSTKEEKLSTGPDVPSTDEDITTMIPEYYKESEDTVVHKQSTTESVLEMSASSETIPEKVAETISDAEGTLLPSTEKSTDVTALIPDGDTLGESSRIPGEGDCLLNGVTYRNNTIVPSSNNCHTGCKCVSSVIKCDPIICSPPPKYMSNCQSIYDTPDSCCPTYICDHPRETIPPQSDNQMSGTESPIIPSTIECRGDQCELNAPIKPTNPSELCTSGDCLSIPTDHTGTDECGPDGCGAFVKKPISLQPSGELPDCSDGKCKSSKEDCASDKCQLIPTDKQQSSIKPCNGDDCVVQEEQTSAPQLCVNGHDCNKIEIPVTQTATAVNCEGNDCDSSVTLLPHKSQQELCKEKDGCKPEKITPSACAGDKPCRRQDIPITEQLPSTCEGDECIQKTDSSLKEDASKLSTTSSTSEETLNEVTEKNIPVEKDEESESTGKPVLDQKGSTTTPIIQSITEQTDGDGKKETLTEEPNMIEKEATKNPNAIESYTDKQISTEEITTQATSIIENTEGNQTTKTPEFVKEYSDTTLSIEKQEPQQPDESDKEQTTKQATIEEEVTIVPDLIEQYTPKSTDVSDTVKDKFDESTVSEESVTRTPIDISTQTPHDVKDYDKHTVVDTTKIPDIIEDHTDEPSSITQDITKIPGDVTKLTDIPYSPEKHETMMPDVAEKETEHKVTLTEEESTDIPNVTKEYSDSVLEIINEHTDDVNLSEESTTKTFNFLEIHTTGPITTTEKVTKVREHAIEYTEKPSSLADINTEIPDNTEKQISDKISSTGEEQSPKATETYYDKPTETLDVIKDHTEKATAEEFVTKAPDVIEEQSSVPVLITGEDTETSENGVDGSDKPTLIEEDSTKIPDIIGKEPEDKLTPVEEQSTKIPQNIDLPGETTKVPDMIKEQTGQPTNFPDIIQEQTYISTKSPASDTKTSDITEKYTHVPDVITEETSKTPHYGVDDLYQTSSPEEDDMKIPHDDEKEKPILVEEELPDKSTDIKETVEKKPEPFEREGVTEPVITEESGTESLEVVEDSSKKPILIDDAAPGDNEGNTSELPFMTEKTSTSKPIVLDEGFKDKPLVSEKTTERPAVVKDDHTSDSLEIEQTDKPELLEVHTNAPDLKITEPHPSQSPDEEGSGTKAPETYISESETETEMKLPESLMEEHTKTPNAKIEKITQSTYESQTTEREETIEPHSVTIDMSSPKETSKSPEIQDSESPIKGSQDSSTDLPIEVTKVTATKQEPPTNPPLREGDQTTYHPSELITTPQEPIISENGVTIVPEIIMTTESVEIIAQSTEHPVIHEQVEGFIDVSENKPEYPATNAPAEAESPDVTQTNQLGEETTTKGFKEENIKSTTSEDTSTLPQTDRVKEVDDMEAGLSEPYEGELENMSTKVPITNKTDVTTKQPDIYTPEKEEMITSVIDTSVTTAPVKDLTETEDILTTGEKHTSTKYVEETTEPLEQLTTKQIEAVSDILISTTAREEYYTEPHTGYTETPILKETKTSETFEIPTTPKSVELAEDTSDSDKSDLEEPYRRTETTNQEKTTPEIAHSTELPLDFVTKFDSAPTATIKEMSILEEHTIRTPDSTSPSVHLDLSTVKPQLYNTSESAVTEVTESHEPISRAPEPSETTASSYSESHVSDNQGITAEAQEPVVNQETTIIPELIAKPESDTLDPETEPEVQKSSSPAPDTLIDIHTDLPHIQITTEAPLSLITHKDVSVVIDKHVDTEAATPKAETGIEKQTTEREDFTTSLHETKTTKPMEASGSTEETSAQVEVSETTPYLIELEEHTHKIIDDISTVSSIIEKEPTYETEEVITTPSPSKDHVNVQEDRITSISEEDHTVKIPERLSTVPTFAEGSTHKIPEDTSSVTLLIGETTTETELQGFEKNSEKTPGEKFESVTKQSETSNSLSEETSTISDIVSHQITSSEPKETDAEGKPILEQVTGVPMLGEDVGIPQKDITTSKVEVFEETTSAIVKETPTKSPVSESDIKVPTEVPQPQSTTADAAMFSTTKATTIKQTDLTPSPEDKYSIPEEKPTNEVVLPNATAEVSKPQSEIEPTDEVPAPEDDGLTPSVTGYGEPDYVEEDQAFGPGTCRYGGKVYVSAQQIPRDDPCDFCFCFRSDIICLQQSCPPPIHGCHEEPIQGFCCPRYECPVSMATTVNVTTTTTTTTTTLPPHFPTHGYKGAAQRRGCQIKGHIYKVGEVVRSSSGPCLHCTCGGDGQMKCDPKACTPEPMLRQMIAAAVSAKRRR